LCPYNPFLQRFFKLCLGLRVSLRVTRARNQAGKAQSVQQKIGASQTVVCTKFLSQNPLDVFDPEVAGAVFLDSSFFDPFPKCLFLLPGQFNRLARSWTVSQANLETSRFISAAKNQP
jgi:hypothetical protein